MASPSTPVGVYTNRKTDPINDRMTDPIRSDRRLRPSVQPIILDGRTDRSVGLTDLHDFVFDPLRLELWQPPARGPELLLAFLLRREDSASCQCLSHRVRIRTSTNISVRINSSRNSSRCSSRNSSRYSEGNQHAGEGGVGFSA